MYLKDLQKRLILIYHLIRKGVPFEWPEEHQVTLEELQKDVSNPSVLVMTHNKGHFTLVSDTYVLVFGATLYQVITGKLRLV